MGFVPDSFA